MGSKGDFKIHDILLFVVYSFLLFVSHHYGSNYDVFVRNFKLLASIFLFMEEYSAKNEIGLLFVEFGLPFGAQLVAAETKRAPA